MKFLSHMFHTWWVFAALLATAVFWAWWQGVVADVIETDVIRVTWVISGFFLFTFVYLGALAKRIDATNWRGVDKLMLDHMVDVQAYEGWFKRRLKLGWFMGQFGFSLGIVGTIIGLQIMMNSTFADGTLSNPDTQDKLLPSIASHYAIALYATAVGLISGMTLMLLTFILTLSVEVRANE